MRDSPGRHRMALPRDPAATSFLPVWTGQLVAQLATQGILLSLPLIALTVLHASPAQVGAITVAHYLPVVAVTVLVATILDGVRKKPVLVWAQVVRATVFLVLACAALQGHLSMAGLLFAVAVGGAASAVFDISLLSYVPAVVPPRALGAANARVQLGFSIAQVVGPALGGLVAGSRHPGAGLLVFAVADALVAVLLLRGRSDDRPRTPAAGGYVRRTRDGFGVVFRSRVLRTLVLTGTWFNLCEQALMTVFLVHAVRNIGLHPQELGVLLALGAVGAVLGALLSSWTARGLGRTATIVWCSGAASAVPWLLFAVQGSGWTSRVVVVAVFFTFGAAVATFSVQVMTARQQLTPPDAQARVSGVYRLFAFGSIGLGGALAGALLTVLGVQGALVTTVALLTLGWVVYARILWRARDVVDDPARLASPAERALAQAP